ncbi:MAG TPA: alpha/beta fold hydrolase [Burkholderiales bacterium]|jgi:pimeloyl-ACP methyl ester carboxylesterase
MAIVLLHCSGSSGAQWRALVAQLDARQRVAAPDLVGHGTLAGEAAPVRSLMGCLDEPIHLVGHSYGGALALHIARTRPERVRSLTLVEPSAFHLLRDGEAMDAVALSEIIEVALDVRLALAAGDLGSGFGRFVDYWSGPGSWAAMPPEKRAACAPQLAKVALDFDALLGDPAGLEDVRDLGLPTLIVQGGATRLPSRCVCRLLRAAMPQAKFEVVPDAGHMLPITHREQVNALVAAHIQRNSDLNGEHHARLAA